MRWNAPCQPQTWPYRHWVCCNACVSHLKRGLTDIGCVVLCHARHLERGLTDNGVSAALTRKRALLAQNMNVCAVCGMCVAQLRSLGQSCRHAHLCGAASSEA